jgi:N-acetyltransferase
MTFPQHIHLEGRRCTLMTMRPSHLLDLQGISHDEEIWKYLPMEGWDSEVFWEWGLQALQLKDNGKAHPFVIADTHTGELLGCTRFQEMYIEHRKLEIGWTWLVRKAWGTGINQEAKLLMLDYAFDYLSVLRVGFKTDENNTRSQQALLGIGASFEGIHRKHMVRPDGSHRNSHFYSITDEDWPKARVRIQDMLNHLTLAVGTQLNEYPNVNHSLTGLYVS